MVMPPLLLPGTGVPLVPPSTSSMTAVCCHTCPFCSCMHASLVPPMLHFLPADFPTFLSSLPIGAQLQLNIPSWVTRSVPWFHSTSCIHLSWHFLFIWIAHWSVSRPLTHAGPVSFMRTWNQSTVNPVHLFSRQTETMQNWNGGKSVLPKLGKARLWKEGDREDNRDKEQEGRVTHPWRGEQQISGTYHFLCPEARFT